MRRLVSRQKIDSLTPIPGADRIEVAHIGGWEVVVGKDEFYPGQVVFYFEIDSMLPLDREYFSFLRERGVTKQDGKEYHRLKTVTLRGQISQGLIFPYEIFEKNPDYPTKGGPYLDPDLTAEKGLEIEEQGGDYSDYFGVVKYEPELPEGNMPFPGWITKTDETRIQSLDPERISQILLDKDNYIATEKLDGTSVTFWARRESEGIAFGVCTRNLGVKYSPNGKYWNLMRKKQPLLETSIEHLLEKFIGQDSCVMQGEFFGEGIQKNPLGVEPQVRIFNLFVDGVQVPYSEVQENYPEILPLWVPILDLKLPETVEEIIKQPDGIQTSIPGGHGQIEGIVWRHKNDNFLPAILDLSRVPEDKQEMVAKKYQTKASFKAISNKYLLSE